MNPINSLDILLMNYFLHFLVKLYTKCSYLVLWTNKDNSKKQNV